MIGIDNLMLSTDDMRFVGEIDPVYYDLPIYNYSNIANEVQNTLKTHSKNIDTILNMY